MSPSAATIGSVWFGGDTTLAYIVNSGQADLTVSSMTNTPIVSGDTTVFVYGYPSLPLTISSGDSVGFQSCLHRLL